MKKIVKFAIAAGIVGTVVAAAVKKVTDRKSAYSDSFDDDLYEYWDDGEKEESENEDCSVCDCENCEDCEKSCKENEE